MLKKLNDKLRIVAIAAVVTFAVLNLADKKEEEVDRNDGFQGEKFDDIW